MLLLSSSSSLSSFSAPRILTLPLPCQPPPHHPFSSSPSPELHLFPVGRHFSLPSPPHTSYRRPHPLLSSPRALAFQVQQSRTRHFRSQGPRILHYQLCSSVGLGGKTSALGEEGTRFLSSETLAWAGKRMFICLYTHKHMQHVVWKSLGILGFAGGRGRRWRFLQGGVH